VRESLAHEDSDAEADSSDGDVYEPPLTPMKPVYADPRSAALSPELHKCLHLGRLIANKYFDRSPDVADVCKTLSIRFTQGDVDVTREVYTYMTKALLTGLYLVCNDRTPNAERRTDVIAILPILESCKLGTMEYHEADKDAVYIRLRMYEEYAPVRVIRFV
jgi:hypothetical protein